jgi:nicotinamide-nucleotide adenylyltransferase
MVASNCLYAGRFRLFHKGYLEVVKFILTESKLHLIITVGAAQSSFCSDNPFTGRERAQMIQSALKDEGLQSRAEVIPIDETNATYGNWTQLMENLCPPFSLVYSHSELVRTLFKQAGYATKPVPQFSTVEFSFASITERIVNNKPWEYLVPFAVAEFMKEHKFDQRVRKIFSTGGTL